MPPVATPLEFDSQASLIRPGSPTIGPGAATGAGVARGAWARPLSEMQAAYRGSGGIASDGDLVCMLRECSEQPLSRLARWIVARDVVSFDLDGTTWLPLFQFEGATLSVLPAVTVVIRELADVFDDWELATWFALPNTWLRGRTPVDAVAACPSAVREAARADRFIARG